MRERYLEVTYRKGRALAAYLYLPRDPGVKSTRTEEAGAGLLVDYCADSRPIGIEITAPEIVTLEEINRVLRSIGHSPLSSEEMKPLQAA